MPSSILRRGSFDGGPRLAALWFGMLGGPLAWAAVLETNYVLSYVACEQRHTWMLHLATAFALAIVALAAVCAWRAAPPAGAEDAASIDPDETAIVRARFMALAGLALSVWSAIVIVAMHVPVLVLQPCM